MEQFLKEFANIIFEYQYFRLGGEYANKQGMTYKYMNDIAIKTFGE